MNPASFTHYRERIGEIIEDPVSLEPLTQAILLPCSHAFNQDTLERISATTSRICPMCRAPFEPPGTPCLALRQIAVVHQAHSEASENVHPPRLPCTNSSSSSSRLVNSRDLDRSCSDSSSSRSSTDHSSYSDSRSSRSSTDHSSYSDSRSSRSSTDVSFTSSSYRSRSSGSDMDNSLSGSDSDKNSGKSGAGKKVPDKPTPVKKSCWETITQKLNPFRK